MKVLFRRNKSNRLIRTVGVLTAAGMVFAVPQAVWATEATAVSDNIVVRDEAVVGAQIGSLSEGQEVTINGEAEGSDEYTWYQITFEAAEGERTGWVRSDLIEESELSGTDVQGQADADENNGITVRFEMTDGYVELMDVPAEEAALVSERFVSAVCQLEGGAVQAYQLAGPDELTASDADLTIFYYVYGVNELGEQGWYIYDSEENVLQKSLTNMQYSVSAEPAESQNNGQTFDMESMTRMIFGGLSLICLLLLVLAIVFSVRYRRLRKLLEDGADNTDESAEVQSVSVDEMPGTQKISRNQKEQKNAEDAKEDYDFPVTREEGYDLPDNDSYDIYDLDELDQILEAEKSSEPLEKADPEQMLANHDLQGTEQASNREDAELERILMEESEKMFLEESDDSDSGEKDSAGKGSSKEKTTDDNDLPEDIEFVDDGIEDEDLEFL